MPDIGEILKLARPREHSITLCLAGDLAAEVDRLEAEMQRAGQWQAASIADEDPRVGLARQIAEARERMQAAEVQFTFRALGARAWSDLVALHPATEEGQSFDPETLGPALVCASAVDPTMSREELDALFEALNHAQREALIEAAWAVNGEATSVPFSLLASATLASHTAGK